MIKKTKTIREEEDVPERPSAGLGFLVRFLALAILLAMSQAGILRAQVLSAPVAEEELELRTIERDEVLWLARLVFSETKRTSEQVMVAWVARNRLESGYRGATSYKEVALDPSQFSGLNSGDEQYATNVSLDYDTDNELWQKSLAVAEDVYRSPGLLRPLPTSVRHFYSPVSMGTEPSWAEGKKPTYSMRADDQEAVRFAFYANVR